jgi:hypothetical protein
VSDHAPLRLAEDEVVGDGKSHDVGMSGSERPHGAAGSSKATEPSIGALRAMSWWEMASGPVAFNWMQPGFDLGVKDEG